MPSKDEQFDFFCKHWEEPVEKDEPKAPKIAVEKVNSNFMKLNANFFYRQYFIETCSRR